MQLTPGAGTSDFGPLSSQVVVRTTERIPVYDVVVVRLEKGVGVRRGVGLLGSDPSVESVTPNYYGRFRDVPNDPHFSEQWSLRNVGQRHRFSRFGSRRGTPDADVDATRAWKTQEGDAATVVAVVDTGVDIKHPDLDGSIWTNTGEIPRDDLDNDGNGYVDDVHGWDVAENDNTLVERNQRVIAYQHGTHIAGVVGAEKDNALGIAGVCPGCRIMPVKIGKPIGRRNPRYMSFRLSDELEGLAYAQEMGADVVNASFGTPEWLRVERDAFVELGRSGVVTVAAAGNSSANLDTIARTARDDPTRLGRGRGPSYPAAYNLPTIITVAASDHDDRYARFTDYGPDAVELTAPGVDIFSTIPDGRYELLSGTSMAAPHVAGAAGLVKSERPLASPKGLRHILMNSVDLPRRMSIGNRRDLGLATRTRGRLNAAEALTASSRHRFKGTDGNIRGAERVTKRARGRLHSPTDFNDVFKRKLIRGDRMEVSLRSRRAPFDLFVWKPGTKDIWQLETQCFLGRPGCALLEWASGSQGLKMIRFRARRTGHYYFHVSGRQDERGRFNLRIRRR